MINWTHITGFDWDAGNERKSIEKHAVSHIEAEQVLFNQLLFVLADQRHSQTEARYHALGKSNESRLLHITFTLRSNNTLIRIISARDMHEKRELFMNKIKTLPPFKTEVEERAFWERHDSSDYIDWSAAQAVRLPNLKPSTKSISLRLPEGLLESIKIEANKRDMPYQSLIKSWLADDVRLRCNR